MCTLLVNIIDTYLQESWKVFAMKCMHKHVFAKAKFKNANEIWAMKKSNIKRKLRYWRFLSTYLFITSVHDSGIVEHASYTLWEQNSLISVVSKVLIYTAVTSPKSCKST